MLNTYIQCKVLFNNELSKEEKWIHFSFNLNEICAVSEFVNDELEVNELRSTIYFASSQVATVDIPYSDMLDKFLNNGNMVKFYGN